MRYKQGDTLIFDGKEINIKMQLGLKKGDVVKFDHIHPLGTHFCVLTKNGNTSCIENRMKKHFKREEK
jgi:hypothetical protein